MDLSVANSTYKLSNDIEMDSDKEILEEDRRTSIETISSGIFHSVSRITITSDDFDEVEEEKIHEHGEPLVEGLSRGHKILLWTGVTLLLMLFLFVFYRLCSLTVRRTMNDRARRRDRGQETLQKILRDSGAREILRSRAITAINSQANRQQRNYSSQFSMESVGSVPDLSERVARVSFVLSEPQGISRNQASSGETESIGGESTVSQPPAYDTLSTAPPQYCEVSKSEKADSADCDKGTSDQKR